MDLQYRMFARVLRLRQMGVLMRASRPPLAAWAVGIFEMSRNGFGGPATARRLVLRDARANPDKGLLFELYQPMLVDVSDAYLRFRGVEGVCLGSGEIGGMVQEWLVHLEVPA
jgi:hypothetical protein